MNYTIQVNEVKNTEGNIRAFASLVFGECFKITNIAILENKEKGQLFVSMPRYRSSQRNEDIESVYKDVCNPITKEFREELYSSILQAYESVKNKTYEKQVKKTDDDKEGQDITGLEFSVSVTMLERENSAIKGIARIFVEDCFVINNVSIIQGKEDLFVAMPSYKAKEVDENNKPIYRDICYPVTKEFREKLYGVILETHQTERQKRLQDASENPVNRREKMQKEMQMQEEKDKAVQPSKRQKK